MGYAVAWAQAAFWKYGPTLAGLVIGTLAKYGLTLSEGRKLTWRGALADVLLLGFLGLIAVLVSDWFALKGDARVLAGALAAVSSDRLVRLVRDRIIASADRKLAAALDLPPDAAVELRDGQDKQHPLATVRVAPATPLRAELRKAYPPAQTVDPTDQYLLDKLKGDL